MFLELIATFIAGIAAAGVIMLINKITGNRLPRWIVPVVAGLAMLGMTISSEYSWYSRTKAGLPQGLAVAQTVENRAVYRPWTYVLPYTNRFVAVDQPATRTNTEDPALKLADLYFYGRWSTVQAVQVMVNCSTGQRADPMEGTTGAQIWHDVGYEDPIVFTVCGKV
jgi:hypothetical protein